MIDPEEDTYQFNVMDLIDAIWKWNMNYVLYYVPLWTICFNFYIRILLLLCSGEKCSVSMYLLFKCCLYKIHHVFALLSLHWLSIYGSINIINTEDRFRCRVFLRISNCKVYNVTNFYSQWRFKVGWDRDGKSMSDISTGDVAASVDRLFW